MNLNRSDNASTAPLKHLDPALKQIIDANHHDPFEVLGRHPHRNGEIFRVYLPQAETVWLNQPEGESMVRVPGTDFFECVVAAKAVPKAYTIHWVDKNGTTRQHADPYCFAPQISDFDIHLFGEGKHWQIYQLLGGHLRTIDGVDGVHFATWAPNAQRVSVVGDFNDWDGRAHPMRVRGDSGIWELFIPGLSAGDLYKFEIANRHNGAIMLKTDPYGQQFELRPDNSSIVCSNKRYQWTDEKWMKQRAEYDWLHRPMSVYEVHLGSWKHDQEGNFLNYRQLAKELVSYIKETGFTHIELMPITEHPYDLSWGYQTTGYFAPTRRHGMADDFRYFIDYCHQHDVGVLLDWVPAHFPKDSHGLAYYDGTALYEHEDPRLGEHRDWGTNIYNFGRNEVKNFLLASALFWLEEFHLDGLRVDAVASMLYLDYSRDDGDWIPNIHGGNENLEAIEFCRDLNTLTHEQHPGSVIIAEESTAWPQVTRPTWTGGLGFSMKWNMGWMHDTLAYMSHDPIHRQYHHDSLSFGLLYAFTENFVLPFSHDEVVHGKNSMLRKMPGDEWRQFANLRLLYTCMFTYPGKKLLFMGCEFAQIGEWNCTEQLEWGLLEEASGLHQGMKLLISDLNKLYSKSSELYAADFDSQGFEWVDCHDSSQSVLSYLRKCEESFFLIVLNFTPIPRSDYRVGVPKEGQYHELINSDSIHYGGSNVGNGWVPSEAVPWMDRDYSISLTLPPLGGIVMECRPEPELLATKKEKISEQ